MNLVPCTHSTYVLIVLMSVHTKSARSIFSTHDTHSITYFDGLNI